MRGKQDSQYMYNVTLRGVRATIVAVGKNYEYYIFWVYVFIALGIEHVMRMRHNVIFVLPHSTVFFRIIS